MNYGIGPAGGLGGGGTGKDSMCKQFLSMNRRAGMGRKQQNYQVYMDKMQQSLNQCVQDKVKPYWRDHNSLKGK
jgi:hypothetical protein